jgi:hypothetical protein
LSREPIPGLGRKSAGKLKRYAVADRSDSFLGIGFSGRESRGISVTAIRNNKPARLNGSSVPEGMVDRKLTTSVPGVGETEVFNHRYRKYWAWKFSGSNRALFSAICAS